jgi:hypothetical protein
MSQDLIPYDPDRRLSKEEQLAHIYGEVACGRSLHSVLEEDEGMPHRRTFWQWHMIEEQVRSDLARARENGIEALLEKAVHVAENPIEAVELEESIGPTGMTRKRSVKEALGHRRLIIDTYHKRAMMLAPRKYGPKLDVTSDGEKISSIAEAIRAGNERLKKDGREQ